MTFDEFKAWLEGFSEGIDKAPTEKQWKKIREKLATVQPHHVTTPVYVPGTWYPYQPQWWQNQPYTTCTEIVSSGQLQATNSFEILGEPFERVLSASALSLYEN